MTTKKELGGQAKELVLLFYEKTGLRFTNKEIMVSVQNAKRLLNAGYTYDEVRDTINYCVANQPPKGIYSFGYITNQISKVTTMLKATGKKVMKEEVMDVSKFSDYGLSNVSNKDKIKEVTNTSKINIFD